jgi:N utilization substance protein B
VPERKFSGRTLSRSQALQILFQADATGRTVDDVLSGDYAITQGPLDPYAESLARGCGSMMPRLDETIAAASQNWSMSRMPSVDRSLLRLAAYEMLAEPDVDVAVAISESVELAKAYGTDDSPKFVNGVLGGIARGLDADVRPPAEGDE